MSKNGNLLLSASGRLKRLFGAVAFLVLVSQSWAQLGLPPIVLLGPANQKVIPGGNAHFSVDVAVSLTPLSYQWQFKGKDIQNATSRTYVRTNVQSVDVGNYSVKVRNAGGTVTSSASLELDMTAVRISSARLDGEGLKLRVAGPLLGTYVVQTSSNLVHWTSISTNLVVAGLLDVTLSRASLENSGHRYYRVLAR